jgi:hypothetical protein
MLHNRCAYTLAQVNAGRIIAATRNHTRKDVCMHSLHNARFTIPLIDPNVHPHIYAYSVIGIKKSMHTSYAAGLRNRPPSKIGSSDGSVLCQKRGPGSCSCCGCGGCAFIPNSSVSIHDCEWLGMMVRHVPLLMLYWPNALNEWSRDSLHERHKYTGGGGTD